MTRQRWVGGNWKMNGSLEANKALLEGLNAALTDVSDVEIVVFPSFVYLAQAQDLLTDKKMVLGAQTLSEHEKGAFTGEISGPMLNDFGCRYVLVGHSERRQLFGESNEKVAQKFEAARKYGLIPVLCVGETQEEREANRTQAVVLAQLKAVVDRVTLAGLKGAVIAYEPVWAIGTGLTATPEQAQEVHAFIRNHIAEYDKALAETIQIVYGGSVKPDNAAEIFAKPDVDGGLIGGASLKAEDFSVICKS